MSYTFEQIGIIHSCFKEKFGIPRQSGLIPNAEATLELLPPYNQPEALQGVEGYSHLWLSFIFHKNIGVPWRPLVRPPRLGGNKRIGVFATRAPVRPNPLGLSVVQLARVDRDNTLLHLKGVDLLDGTPIVDIKPYLPYADAISNAVGGFAANAPNPSQLRVSINESAQRQLAKIVGDKLQPTSQLIQQLLQLDPRPAYMRKSTQAHEFGMRLYNFNLRWRVAENQVEVFEIIQVEP